MTSSHRIYNLKRDIPSEDSPAVTFHVDKGLKAAVTRFDLRPTMPAIYDQGNLGSCTANAIGAAYQFNQIRQRNPENLRFVPSRLFIYYNERVIEDTVNEDAGAMLSTGVSCVSTIGVVPETEWPYDIEKFTERPPDQCFTDAQNHRCTRYYRVAQRLGQLRQALLQRLPIIFGMLVYESFETSAVARTGNVPMPRRGESILGGHAVLIVGFNDSRRRFIVRNSWGTDWGINGYFTLPYAFVTNPNYCFDFWVLATVRDVNTSLDMEQTTAKHLKPTKTEKDEPEPENISN